ncbi:MAG TPA: amino acid adenylation domain-containing protein, partial [Hymenobacter sp.]|nr:amino acid adenylation domain-containing protein [Hymenobacter sp.]
TLADLLEEQVARTPEQTALVFEGQRLSYQQLNQQANNVAHYLQTHYALAPDDCVGLLMERSSNLIIAMLGILKAGAAYVPLDPTYPEQRQQAILRESNCKVVLTQATTGALLPCPSVDITLLPEAHNANPRRTTQPQHLAYVIYSSGTTGKPKGIMIEHRSIVNLLYYYNEKYGLPQQKGILQVTNVVVDIALQEVFSALMNGLTLYVPTQEMIYDPAALRQYLQQHRISFVQLIPDTLRAYLAGQPQLDNLQAVLCGGDKLPDKLRDQVLEQGYPLYNVYGQTETTIDALVSRCQVGESGLEEVVANYQVHVVDSQGRRQPLGVAGEICIGGVGVGRGYLNEEALTNEKFVANPFGEGRLYKTGDLGRWLVNGRLEFIGRADTQVKVRGYRIELAEVERALLSNAQVQEAVVVAQGEASEEKYLCAYYILTGTGGMPSEKLREYLQSLLPSYMVPSYLLEVVQLPVNANGKIDRSALPLPDKTHHSKNYLAPRNEIEEKLAQVWQDVLKAG